MASLSKGVQSRICSSHEKVNEKLQRHQFPGLFAELFSTGQSYVPCFQRLIMETTTYQHKCIVKGHMMGSCTALRFKNIVTNEAFLESHNISNSSSTEIQQYLTIAFTVGKVARCECPILATRGQKLRQKNIMESNKRKINPNKCSLAYRNHRRRMSGTPIRAHSAEWYEWCTKLRYQMFRTV